MRFFHLSDLHFGKQLHGYDLEEEQRDFIARLKSYREKYRPDVILVSGDIYDKSVPSAASMTILDDFLVSLNDTPAIIIAGNHDSVERLNYAGTFLEKHNIYISVLPPKSDEEYMKKITFKDEYGNVNFYLLPFIKPGMVRQFMPEDAAQGEQAVIKALIDREKLNLSERNVILSHQFYVNMGVMPQTSESESIVAGGLGAVEISVLSDFDYGALGHIHRPQKVGSENFRYCGTPIKYSVSEANQEKSIVMVDMGAKEEKLNITLLPLEPLRDVVKFTGTLNEIIKSAAETDRGNYISITLTDEDTPVNAKEKLEAYFDNILEINVDNTLMRNIYREELSDIRELQPDEAFKAFFSEIKKREMNRDEEKLLAEILDEVQEVNE